ncbi:GreA/GreB family transcription elongation factor [Dyadobacter jejuensis]|uniref:GreA/GreB family transcription elongation factor n=1 Tax=Dyadobacter jejuensis TaxID=1082580 RepID=A0A316ACW1_9BACT|nr:GreA/GreB family elongation factor [Dyadobacter jejuensis]PWJ55595.1 GreA/GreB family transcription elongation factor [Dyadobacter jejuensis]
MDKSGIVRILETTLDERMQHAKKAMDAAQQSANEQGKSSVGDKYETARSMGQLDRDMFARQYESARQERLILERINPQEVHKQVTLGSVVDTTAGWFFVAVSFGKLAYLQESVMVVSSLSPIGRALLGKSAGDSFDFMGKKQQINAVE